MTCLFIGLGICVVFIVFIIWSENLNRTEKQQMSDHLMSLLRQQIECTNFNRSLVTQMQGQVDEQVAITETLMQALQMSNKNVTEAIKERDRKDEYIKSLEDKVAKLVERDFRLATFINFMYPSYTYCVKDKRVEKVFSRAELQHIEALSCKYTGRCVFHHTSAITFRGESASFNKGTDPVKADEACAARKKAAEELGYVFITQEHVCRDADSRMISCIVFQEKGQPSDEAWAFTIEYFLRWPAGEQRCFLVKKNVIEKTEWVPAVPEIPA